tara:strand:- start:147 stop:275 length:129 start_codon:yes stop_codon:yes gene_type:complete
MLVCAPQNAGGRSSLIFWKMHALLKNGLLWVKSLLLSGISFK